MARLRSFSLENFRSYKEATLKLGTLTLLVGANASGKSNLIEGLQMLSWLARGQRLEDVFRAVQEAEMSIRGQPTHLARDGETSFSFACNIALRRWGRLAVTIKSNGGGLRITDERVTDFREIAPLYEVRGATSHAGHDLQVAYNNFLRGGKKPQIACTDQQAVFTQLLTPARFNSSHKKAQVDLPLVCGWLMSSLRQILFLDPMPQRMRNSSFSDDKQLRGDGSNLSSALFSLNKESKAAVLSFIKDLPEQNITDIDFLRGPRNDVLVRLEETFGSEKKWRDATLLSDGTLRVLAVAAALLSAPEFSTVVMEEIDNGIHPSRAHTLLTNVQKIAERRKLAVLITSHNPALLDALPEKAVPDVVFCYRDPEAGDSRLVRLEDLPNYSELVARGPLGRLVTQGVLDRMVKQAQPEDERQAAGLRYVEELKKS
ncbi:MAG: AAA family ATPase [Verrucomicrobia bacterium]|nr:AAA family ATPase [Verrucomicrobiota bacterium]